MLIHEKAVRQLVADLRPGGKVSREYLERLDGKVRFLIKQDLEIPRNRKVMRDTWPASFEGH